MQPTRWKGLLMQSKIKVRNLAGYDEDEESEEEEHNDDGSKSTKTFLKQAKFYRARCCRDPQ